jgi:hypothetical protein
MKKIILTIMLIFINHNTFASTAVYYSPSSNLIFLKKRQISEDIAIQKAKSACEAEADDCRLTYSAENAAYVAIAAHKRRGFNVTMGAASKKEAETTALKKCVEAYGECKIYSSFFDAVYSPPPPPYTPIKLA